MIETKILVKCLHECDKFLREQIKILFDNYFINNPTKSFENSLCFCYFTFFFDWNLFKTFSLITKSRFMQMLKVAVTVRKAGKLLKIPR